MKTDKATATAQAPEPGNLSTRQLAKSLTKTAPATEPKKDTTEPAKGKGKETTREVPPAKIGEPELEPTDKLNEVKTPEKPEIEPAPETTEAAEETPETPAEEPESTDEPPKSELPNEVREAMEIAKAQDGGKGKAELLKRVHKLVDERDTHRNARLAAEEQNKQLRSELQEARKQPAQGQEPRANGAHPAVAKLQEQIANTDRWISWCDENPDGGDLPDGKDGTVTLSAKQVAKVQRDLENQRQELVASKANAEQTAKAAYAEQFKQHHATAVREYGWLTKPESPEHQEMQTILQVFPAFKQAPDYELAIGDFLAGKALREAKAKARANGAAVPRKPAPAREPTRVVTDPPGGGARKLEGDEEVKAAEAQFKKTGKSSDLAKWQSAKARRMRLAA